MEPNPSTIKNNDYDEVNPIDGSQKHPNKYELLEKRQGQIAQAIESVLKGHKNDVLKRPVVGIATLVRRELQQQGGVVIKNDQEQDAFDAEYHTDAIVTELAKIVGFEGTTDYAGLKDAVDEYLK